MSKPLGSAYVTWGKELPDGYLDPFPQSKSQYFNQGKSRLSPSDILAVAQGSASSINETSQVTRHQIKMVTSGQPRRFTHQHCLEACLNSPALAVIVQHGYALIGCQNEEGELVVPEMDLARENIPHFLAFAPNPWALIPRRGWKIWWEVDVLREDVVILHPFLPSMRQQMASREGNDELLLLESSILSALALENLSIPRTELEKHATKLP